MEHLVQFGINVDDDAIRNTILASAEKKIMQNIELGVIEKMFEGKYYNSKPYEKVSYSSEEYKIAKDATLKGWAKDLIIQTMEDWKPEIIDKVADSVAEKLCRSKKFKESVLEEIK